MTHFNRTRTALLTTAAMGCLLLTGAAASAQTVRIFEEAPSIEQLRSIMIPESHGGATRSIVLMRSDATASRPAVPVALVQPADAPVRPVAKVLADPAASIPNVVAPAAAPAHETRVAAKAQPNPAAHDDGAEAGIVGFHINFALNSATLPNTAFVFIDRMAELMKLEPQVTLQVEGHTDASGSADYNQALSERRAAAVADYLVHQRGIAAERLIVKGMGMTAPMTANPFDGQNRRVQFVRLG